MLNDLFEQRGGFDKRGFKHLHVEREREIKRERVRNKVVYTSKYNNIRRKM